MTHDYVHWTKSIKIGWLESWHDFTQLEWSAYIQQTATIAFSDLADALQLLTLKEWMAV